MTVMVKLTGTIKVSCLLPTTYTNKFHQNRLYLAKTLSLLPAPLPERGDISQPTTMDSEQITKNPPFPPRCLSQE